MAAGAADPARDLPEAAKAGNPVADLPEAAEAGNPAGSLPELARVPWRPLVSERSLRLSARLWTFTSLAHCIPFAAVALALALVKPVTIPVALVLLAHAWIIPELYAARGANVVREAQGRPLGIKVAAVSDEQRVRSERRALGLLGDLVGHEARELLAQTGLVMERGELGVWLVGEKGALLVRPRGRRVNCYCVGVPEADLPEGDRIAHLLLALRADERGFATVANLAFSGASWRVRRRLSPRRRPALAAAVRKAHSAWGNLYPGPMCA